MAHSPLWSTPPHSPLPRKQETLTQGLCKIGPASQKMGQPYINIVCRAYVSCLLGLAKNLTFPQAQEIVSMLVNRWSTVYDVRPTLILHWFNILCLLGDITWWTPIPNILNMDQRCRWWAELLISIGSNSLIPCWFYINHSIAKHVCNRLNYVSVDKISLLAYCYWVCA